MNPKSCLLMTSCTFKFSSVHQDVNKTGLEPSECRSGFGRAGKWSSQNTPFAVKMLSGSLEGFPEANKPHEIPKSKKRATIS